MKINVLWHIWWTSADNKLRKGLMMGVLGGNEVEWRGGISREI